MRRTIAIGWLAIGIGLAAGPQAAATEAGAELLDQVQGRVEESFCWKDRLSGIWPEELVAKHRAKTLAAESAEQDLLAINALLRELGASHAELMPRWVYNQQFKEEQRNRDTLRFGFELARRQDKEGVPRYFVGDVLRGGPADWAGVRRGDEVLLVDALDPVASPRTIWFGDRGVRAQPHLLITGTEPVTLTIRTIEGGAPFAVKLEPARFSRNKASATTVQTFRRGGKTIGYLRLYHVLHPRAAEVVEEALEGEFKDTDGLVLDLRGWGGRVDVLQRILDRLPGGRRPMYDKQVVALTDERTRSAKEVIADGLKRRKIPLVGRRTAGAVLACRFFGVGDDHVLMLPIIDLGETSDKLEHHGVTPDVQVDDDLPFAGGRDRLLETGVATLLERLESAAREPTLF
ncbi:MAG: S41 family peptidase [Planctomycetota bacterium]